MLDNTTLDQVMGSLGGKKTATSDDTYWLFFLGSVLAEFRPYSRNSKGMLLVGVSTSLSQPELSRITNIIMNRKSDTWCQFDYHQTGELMPITGDAQACLRGVVKHEMERLKSMSLRDIVDKFETPYPSVESKTQEQTTHLAVLAYTGNVSRLTEYLNWFKQGKRYNFKQSINQGTIEAAIAIAQERIKENK